MFTGIVECMGKVVALETRGDLARLVIEAPELASAVALGDSVAVNGACLTIAETHPDELHVDAIPETLDHTSLGELCSGSPVNLERAMRADSRFDGHIVQGHVDEAGSARALRRQGDDVRLSIQTTSSFASSLVHKGSVTVDGVSLTVAQLSEDGFEVALIPHTLEVTTLGRLRPGSRVNLESDILGKYVQRFLERTRADEASSTGSRPS